VLAKDPEDVDALVNKGISLGYQGKHDEAIACYDRVLAKDPDDANALVKKGVSLGYQGKHDEAIACYDRVLAKYPMMQMPWSKRCRFELSRQARRGDCFV